MSVVVAWGAYGAAKLENMLFTMELHRRYHHRGLSTVAFYPGNVATNFGSETTSKLMRFTVTNRIIRSMLIWRWAAASGRGAGRRPPQLRSRSSAGLSDGADEHDGADDSTLTQLTVAIPSMTPVAKIDLIMSAAGGRRERRPDGERVCFR